MNTAVQEEQLLKGSMVKLNDEYSIRVVDNLSEFETLREVWDSLASQQKEYFPFLCFDWFNIWLKHFLKGDKLLIIVLHNGEKIVAIAPFIFKKEKFKGINVSKIELIGNVYSPIRVFLFNELNNEIREKYVSFILEFFFKIYKYWDILDLNSIPEENNYFAVFEKAIKRTGFRYSSYFGFGDWYLDEINFSGDEYFNKFPSKFRHNIKYRLKELEKKGCLEFKVIDKEENAIDQYMNIYYDVYSKSWQQREGVGPTFHRDLAKLAIRNGWLRLGFLFLNGYPLASQFWLSCNGTAYILKTVYDQEYRNSSPGKILTLEMFRYLIDNDKVITIDYVQGDELYKKDWTPQRRERKGITVYNNNMRGGYLDLLNNKVLPVLRKSKYMRKLKDVVKGVRNEKYKRDVETSSS